MRYLFLLPLFLLFPASASAQYVDVQKGTDKGVVLYLHGGGWKGDLTMEQANAAMAPYIDTTSSNYTTVNLAYRSYQYSLPDAINTFNWIRRHYPRQDVCILGTSAGAQLALMIAARYPRHVECVVDIVGPPDLVDPGDAEQAHYIREWGIQAFGVNNLRRMSPVYRARSIRKVNVMIAANDCDVFIPWSKQVKLKRALGSKARLVQAGTEHCWYQNPPEDAAFRERSGNYIRRHLR